MPTLQFSCRQKPYHFFILPTPPTLPTLPLTGVGFLQSGVGQTRMTRWESRQGRKTEPKKYGSQ